MEKERDLSGFDKNVMELFDLCKDILKAKERRALKGIERSNPFFNRLEKYIKTYTKTEPEEHVSYFEKIYGDNKRFILLGPQRDAWLSESSIVISYGEDCGLKTEMKIHLSGIYFTACKIRDEIREEVEGLPDTTNNIETEYPSRFLLFLYRIFREIVSSDVEKTKLSTHIETLESSTGIRSSNKGKGGDDNLFDMAAGMAEQVLGTKINKDNMPGKGDITKMMSDVFNNPQTKSMLGSVMSSLKDANGTGDIVSKLVGALGSVQSQAPSSNTVPTATAELPSTSGNVNDEFDE
jgi:hypothetical protein